MNDSPENERPTRMRFIVLALLGSSALVAYYQRTAMGTAKEEIGQDLALSFNEIGSVSASFFLGYALFQIPSGLIRDFLGSRAALTTFTLLWSLATAMVGTAESFYSLYVAWAIAGAAQAGVFPCAVVAIKHWIPRAQRAMSTGLMTSFMSVGGSLANATVAYLIFGVEGWFEPLGWRGTFFALAVPGFVWTVFYLLLFRNRPEQHPWVNEAERALIHAGDPIEQIVRDDTVIGAVPWGAIFGNLALWGLFIQQFFRASGYVFFQTWFPRYLQETRGVSIVSSGWLGSLPLVAVIFGSILGGMLSDHLTVRLGRPRLGRQYLALGGLAACALLSLVAYAIASAVTASVVISLGMFFSSFAGTCAYVVAIDKGGRQTATVFSTMNMAGNMGAFLLPYLLPHFVAATSWNMVLPLFAAIHALAALSWLMVDPCGSIDDSPQEPKHVAR